MAGGEETLYYRFLPADTVEGVANHVLPQSQDVGSRPSRSRRGNTVSILFFSFRRFDAKTPIDEPDWAQGVILDDSRWLRSRPILNFQGGVGCSFLVLDSLLPPAFR